MKEGRIYIYIHIVFPYQLSPANYQVFLHLDSILIIVVHFFFKISETKISIELTSSEIPRKKPPTCILDRKISMIKKPTKSEEINHK